MLISRFLTSRCHPPKLSLLYLRQIRFLHPPLPGAGEDNGGLLGTPKKPSLLEELFPEEAQKSKRPPSISVAKDYKVPRLPLPEVEELLDALEDDIERTSVRSLEVTRAAVANAFRRNNPAVLILRLASNSLVESDFRRIAPRGQHIDHWTGPGDILKVIPARDSSTLEQTGHYFILFPNPAYARAYQDHAVRLHRMSRMHTPTSIESPLPLQDGVIIDGENAYALLQDYALCPPSQKIKLKALFSPYTAGMKRLIDQRGYSQLMANQDKTGKAVLMWVEGQPTTAPIIKHAIGEDGRERGMPWAVSIEKMEIQTSSADDPTGPDNVDNEESAELKPQRHNLNRWILSFEDENEARRFVRAWHRKPFASAQGDGPATVQAEFMW